MRVLQVIQELRRGGAETVVHTLVSALAARGDHVEVAAATGPWADAFTVPVHPLPLVAQRPTQLLDGTAAVHRAIRWACPDVVHCHNPTMALISALPTWRGRRPPTLVTVHGVEAEQYAMAARVLRLSGAAVVACGPGVRSALTAAGAKVSRTIPNGVAPAAPAHPRAELRRSFGLPEDATVIASVGRLVPLKRHDLAIRALSLLPEVYLLVVGAGDEEGTLRQQAVDTGVVDRVVFTGLRDDVSALLGAVDAMVLCSRGEGLPLTLLESLAAGTAVVAVDVPGVREVVRHEHDGLLCAATPEALADAVQRVRSDATLATRLTTAGLETVRPYAEARMIEDYLDAYRRLRGGEPL